MTRAPWTAPGATQHLRAAVHVDGDIDIPARILTSPLGPILLRALELNPEDRYPDAAQLRKAVAAIDPADVPSFTQDPLTSSFSGTPTPHTVQVNTLRSDPGIAALDLPLARPSSPQLVGYDPDPDPEQLPRELLDERPSHLPKLLAAAMGILVGLLAITAALLLAPSNTEEAPTTPAQAMLKAPTTHQPTPQAAIRDVQVITQPRGAQVSAQRDGRWVELGESPVKLTFAPDQRTRTILVKLNGYSEARRDVSADEGQVSVKLNPNSTRIAIQTDPPGALLFVAEHGRYKPLHAPEVVFSPDATRSVTVRAVKPGYAPQLKSVAPTDASPVTFNLVRAAPRATEPARASNPNIPPPP